MTTTPAKPATLTIDSDIERRQHARAIAALIEGEVRFDLHNRMLYSTDASIYQVEPIGVVIPASVNDIPKVLAYCNEHNLPVLPRGGGTSLAGQCTSHAVVIDVSANCRRILGFDTSARTAHVETGITITDLNSAIASSNLFFAPDPATIHQANIGGCIGNNAAGTRSIKYGRTSESILAIDALLADGSPVRFDDQPSDDPNIQRLREGVAQICTTHAGLIRERFPKTLRRNAGYALDMILAQLDSGTPTNQLNLAPLICGSEGTLCLATGALLKLYPVPEKRTGVLLSFDSIIAAVARVPDLVAMGASAVELIDDALLDVARRNLETKKHVRLMPDVGGEPPKAVLYVEFMDTAPAADQSAQRALESAGEFAGKRLLDAEQIEQIMALRRAGEPLLHAVPGPRKPLGFIEDNAVPVERLPEFVQGLQVILEEEGTTASFWAHASVGVLHVRPMLSLRDNADKLHMERIATRTAALAKSLGGVMSGEHGDGKARGPLLEDYFGPELIEAFREIKALFDPRGLLNPGNIVEPKPIDSIHEQTRIEPAASMDTKIAGDKDTYFDYTANEGFGHAIEACNGSGVCRKKQGGTMCPSYRATLDERHSTRGRGNALRLALSGQLGDQRLGNPDVLETLDLCLSCKGCKAECPSNVDVGRYKAEYLAQTYRKRGRVPLLSRLIADIRKLNRMGSGTASLANAVNESKLGRAIINKVMGIAPERSLPRFEKSLMQRVRNPEENINVGIPEDAPWVAIYADCFTAFNEPEIAIAAARVLNAMGFCVDIIDAGCCGRPAMSTGLLDKGASLALDSASQLQQIIDKGGEVKAVIALEPSCLSAVRDEWQGLKATQSQTAEVAKRFTSFEEFVIEHWDASKHADLFPPPVGRAVLHAHCHQKALWGQEATIALLNKVAPGKVTVLDAGCCGMAGAFGFTADHYEISMRIAELELLPRTREMSENDTLVAPGTSCRHQVLDGADALALHPAAFAASCLREA